MTKTRNEMHGPSDTLDAERCVVELQRGREVLLMEQTGSFAMILVEMLTPEVWEAIRSSNDCKLVLTGNRAKALGRTQDDSIAVLEISTDNSLQTVQALAGLSSLQRQFPASNQWQSIASSAAAAALNLTKAAHALPAALLYPKALTGTKALSVSLNEARTYKANSGALMPMSRTRIPLAAAQSAELMVFKERHGNAEHVAITVGNPSSSEPVTVRLHSSCFTGDILGSLRCDCGEQLNGAISNMAKSGGGIILYLSQEGRGIGLASKLRAYQLQDEGLDTIEANQHLGFGDDDRHYDAATTMLRILGIEQIRLVTNNPRKIAALSRDGIVVVDRLPSLATVNKHNAKYLETKRERAGHLSNKNIVA